ncbi:MAG: hypothetical protein M5U19_15090 [Microthrixaceae bacterium]|nr:hypothetical protein [Microthrixaceae bacterium]
MINHPIVSAPGSGWVDDHMVDPPEQYWQLGPYLPEVTTTETVAEDVTSRSTTGRCRTTSIRRWRWADPHAHGGTSAAGRLRGVVA